MLESVKSNKKLIIAGIVAALCLAVVAGFGSMAVNNADAVDSPEAPVVSVNGCKMMVSDIYPAGKSVDISQSAAQASNVPAGVTPLANYSVTSKDGAESATLTFAYDNAAAVAGQTATVYVQHGDNSTQELTGTFSNSGTLTFNNVKFSIFSIATSFNADASNTSPKTGN